MAADVVDRTGREEGCDTAGEGFGDAEGRGRRVAGEGGWKECHYRRWRIIPCY